MKAPLPPGDAPYTPRTPRVSAAVKLHRRREREKAGLFLAEGPQAVREALAAGVVRELFVTAAGHGTHAAGDISEMSDEARGDHYGDQHQFREMAGSQRLQGSHFPEMAAEPKADLAGVRVSVVTDEAMQALAETVTPQGVVAVCELIDIPLATALAKEPRLVAVAVDVRDPGNAGAILRTADAAGAGAVVFAGETVDPYNGKCVRASAGSLFHVDIVRERDTGVGMRQLQEAGLLLLATSGRGEYDLFEIEPRLAQRTAWLFGGEAHGLPERVLDQAQRVRVPLYGQAESLNLAAAAAVCLYASARAHRSAL